MCGKVKTADRIRGKRQALESLLSGDVDLAKEILRDYINATVGFPKLAVATKIHVKTIHHMLGPKGNPTASGLFEIVAYLQEAERVRFEVRPVRGALRRKRRAMARRTKRGPSAMRR
jgi:DNA-binding phage protein